MTSHWTKDFSKWKSDFVGALLESELNIYGTEKNVFNQSSDDDDDDDADDGT